MNNETDAQVTGVVLEKAWGNNAVINFQLNRKVPMGEDGGADVFGFLLAEEQVFGLATQIVSLYSRAVLPIIGQNKLLEQAVKKAM